MVPCAAMRIALAHPRWFKDQPGIPRSCPRWICVFWRFLIEGAVGALIERLFPNPCAKAPQNCCCPARHWGVGGARNGASCGDLKKRQPHSQMKPQNHNPDPSTSGASGPRRISGLHPGGLGTWHLSSRGRRAGPCGNGGGRPGRSRALKHQMPQPRVPP